MQPEGLVRLSSFSVFKVARNAADVPDDVQNDVQDGRGIMSTLYFIAAMAGVALLALPVLGIAVALTAFAGATLRAEIVPDAALRLNFPLDAPPRN